jgi:O-antigen/teichoic acid export membrane protein
MFLENKLVIPPDRMFAARWVFQLSVISSMISITQVPYNATLIAHERMAVYAYVEILNSLLKLGIVYLLILSDYDKLILYSALILCVTIIITTIYKIYCSKHFSESHYKFVWERNILKPMISFSSWNLFGASASVFKNQGINMLLNIFFGPTVNAANAIANQVNIAVSNFSSGFTTALTPQIVKNYASNDISTMKNLIFKGGRYTFFLLMVLIIPIFLETDFILKIWLKKFRNMQSN